MDTINEAATKHVRTHFTGQFVTHADPRESFLKGVEFAQRWIPVEEELPDYLGEDILILAKRNDNEIMVMVIEEYEDVRNLADGYWKFWRLIKLD